MLDFINNSRVTAGWAPLKKLPKSLSKCFPRFKVVGSSLMFDTSLEPTLLDVLRVNDLKSVWKTKTTELSIVLPKSLMKGWFSSYE